MKMQRLGIDLSEHNGDFKSSRLDDFEFVMIRTGYGSINKDKQEDKQVYNNVKNV